MIGGSRKVQPQQHQQSPIEFESGWSSSDEETISSFTFALRKVIKTDISRNFDKSEIEEIEKRFDDTSKVIFKELENFNRSFLQKSYRWPLKSDIVAIDGTRLASPEHNTITENKNERNGNRKGKQAFANTTPKIENVWHGQEFTPGESSLPVPSINNTTKQAPRMGKNTVSPAVQNNENNRRRRGGMCRVT